MDCWRQWVRHRTASINEYSTRYSVAIDAAQRTSPGEWRLQATSNKQGSGETASGQIGERLSAREREVQDLSRAVYEERLTKNIAREQARKDLPPSTYTEAYWKCDLHNLFNFLRLRLSSHAQLEIRQYARVIEEEIVSRRWPAAWQAFVDYQLNTLSLTGHEVAAFSALARGDHQAALAVAEQAQWLEVGTDGLKSNRERAEAEAKARAGLVGPVERGPIASPSAIGGGRAGSVWADLRRMASCLESLLPALLRIVELHRGRIEGVRVETPPSPLKR